MTLKTVHAIVKGRVQGVFFRSYTKDEAERLGLGGWVRNLADGSVEALFSGEEHNVNRMLKWLETGSPMSQVASIITDPVSTHPDYNGFIIKY